MTDERWRSPLSTRYASPAMQTLWGEAHRISLWRRLWLALAESERELGLDIPDSAIAQMRAHLDDADLAEFEGLLNVLDTELFQWVSGELPTPVTHDTPLFRRIVGHRRRRQF